MMGSNARRNGGTCDLVKLGDAYRLIYESGPHDALTDIALATLRALIERRMGRALQSNENAEVSDRRAHAPENTTGANGGSLH